MKRRAFLQTGLAAAAMPALPIPTGVTPAMAHTLAPNAARFWATYFAALPGHSPVRGVQIAMNVSAGQARRVVSGFVAQGVLAPTALTSHAHKPLIKFDKTVDVPLELRNLRQIISCTCADADDSLVQDQDRPSPDQGGQP